MLDFFKHLYNFWWFDVHIYIYIYIIIYIRSYYIYIYIYRADCHIIIVLFQSHCEWTNPVKWDRVRFSGWCYKRKQGKACQKGWVQQNDAAQQSWHWIDVISSEFVCIFVFVCVGKWITLLQQGPPAFEAAWHPRGYLILAEPPGWNIPRSWRGSLG